MPVLIHRGTKVFNNLIIDPIPQLDYTPKLRELGRLDYRLPFEVDANNVLSDIYKENGEIGQISNFKFEISGTMYDFLAIELDSILELDTLWLATAAFILGLNYFPYFELKTRYKANPDKVMSIVLNTPMAYSTGIHDQPVILSQDMETYRKTMVMVNNLYAPSSSFTQAIDEIKFSLKFLMESSSQK